MKTRLSSYLFILVSLSHPSVRAQDLDQQSSVNAEPRITIEEIVITAERSFFTLQNQLETAKKELFSAYNDVNDIEEFNVNCRSSNWTGTRIQDLECWPLFFERAVAENSQDFIRGNDIPIPTGQLQTMYGNKFEEFQAHILKIATENASIAESIMEVGKLEMAIARKREECMNNPAYRILFIRLCRTGSR